MHDIDSLLRHDSRIHDRDSMYEGVMYEYQLMNASLGLDTESSDMTEAVY
jgi:hypothetical protein